MGGAVCRAAVQRGWRVPAFGRRPSVGPGHLGSAPYASHLLGAGPEPPEVDAVIRCAGSVTDWGRPRDIWAANVDGTRDAAAAGPVGHGVFNVTDAEPVVLDDALRAILTERGIDAEQYHLPLGLAEPLAAVTESVFRLFGRRRPPRLTRYAAGHLAVERTLDITAARERLGFQPAETSFEGAAGW